MIANITQGGFLNGIIEYNEKKVKKGEAQLLSVENTISGSVKEASKLMLYNASTSKRKNLFFHVSLNFPLTDRPYINDKKIRMISLDYMKKMGFPEDHPIIIYKHDDTEHPHVHIVTTNILHTGKPVSDSNNRYTSKRMTRKLEKEYNLTRVNSIKNQDKIFKEGSGLNKNIASEVELVLKRYKPKNIDELNRHLQMAQLRAAILPKEANHDDNNVDQNIVYHRLDENNERIDKGIKSSSLHLTLQANALKKEFAKNKRRDPLRKQIQKQIDSILAYYQKLNLDEFKKKLATKNIALNYTLDAKNNLVGISYTDLKSEIKYTGEKLGQKYKASVISNQITLGKTEHRPENITKNSIKPIIKKLLTINPKEQLKALLYLGFRIKEDKGILLINDYKNASGKGYVPLKELGLEINQNIRKYNIDTSKINFSNISTQKLFILNRKSLQSGKALRLPIPDSEKRSSSIKANQHEHQTSTSSNIKTSNEDEFTISDFDKKKKKGKGNKI